MSDITPWLQAAIDRGGNVAVPRGEHAVSALVLPDEPLDVVIRGESQGTTRLVAADPSKPIFELKTSGCASRCVVEHMTLACAAGQEAAAVEMKGQRACVWRHLTLEGPWPVGFLLGGFPCYGNLIEHVFVQGQKGLGRVVASGNDGEASTNANGNVVRHLWCYANDGMVVAVDLGDTTLGTLEHGVIEANAGAVGLRPGQLTRSSGVWYEGGLSAVAPDTSSGLTPNGLIVEGNYFSGGAILTVPPSVAMSSAVIQGNAGGLLVRQASDGQTWRQ